MLDVSQSNNFFLKNTYHQTMRRCFITLKFNPGDENFESKETKLQLE